MVERFRNKMTAPEVHLAVQDFLVEAEAKEWVGERAVGVLEVLVVATGGQVGREIDLMEFELKGNESHKVGVAWDKGCNSAVDLGVDLPLR